MKTTGTNAANVQARERLLASLEELLNKKKLSAITVAELTNLANVSRMTFYRNYSSIEQILTDQLDDVISSYAESDIFQPEENRIVTIRYAAHFLEFMRENQRFINCLLISGMGDLVLNAVTDYELKKWKCKPEDIILNCKVRLFAGGLYNLYVFWASHAFSVKSEELADVINQFYAG